MCVDRPVKAAILTLVDRPPLNSVVIAVAGWPTDSDGLTVVLNLQGSGVVLIDPLVAQLGVSRR
jgi:hypothetical protein